MIIIIAPKSGISEYTFILCFLTATEGKNRILATKTSITIQDTNSVTNIYFSFLKLTQTNQEIIHPKAKKVNIYSRFLGVICKIKKRTPKGDILSGEIINNLA